MVYTNLRQILMETLLLVRKKPEESEWLYELCILKEQQLYDPQFSDDIQLQSELEKNFRQLIKQDPQHFKAKIKIARLLVNKNAIEEAQSFIDEVENDKELSSDNNQKKALIKLEMLGSFYCNPNVSKMDKKRSCENSSR